MSVATKISGYGKTIWSHKKKVIFFGSLGAWGLSYLNQLNNEQILRTSYAKKAERIGATTIGSLNSAVDYVPPKFHVFVDKSDSLYHKNLASFTKNVLPLLQLAGFDVTVTDTDNEEELRTLSGTADVKNCAGVALVGNQQFALPAVLSGLFSGQPIKNGHQGRAPLAIFDPSDRDNIEARCGKAMRIINGQKEAKHLYSTDIYTKNPEDNTVEKLPESSILRIANLKFGWIDFVQEKEPKFWWFGPLSERLAFTWYFLKNYPQPTSFVAQIQPQCTGCRRCVTEAPKDPNEEKNEQRWWQQMVGRKEQPGDKRRRQYANVINKECGQHVESRLEAVDLDVKNLNEGVYGGLRIRTIEPFTSRWQAIWRVWTQWDTVKSPENFLTDHFNFQSVELKVDGEMSNVVRQSRGVKKLDERVDSEEQISRIVVKALPNFVQLY